ncbi:MAG: hypothetical protein VX294_10305 [Candidatus Latescibacterota bacterium]|nr:hypothetical protein [Candidatus Latescibacterota bacterium]
MLATDSETPTNADEKRKQTEKLQKLVTAQTQETANLIKSWLEKQKTKSSNNLGTRRKVD